MGDLTTEPLYTYYPGKGWQLEMPVIGQTVGRAKFKIEFREPKENEYFSYDWSEHSAEYWVDWLKDQRVDWLEKNTRIADELNVDYYKGLRNGNLYFVTFVRWK